MHQHTIQPNHPRSLFLSTLAVGAIALGLLSGISMAEDLKPAVAAVTTTPAPEAKPDTAVAKPKIDAHADEWLRRMSNYLAKAPYFSLSAEVWQDVNVESGQQVQTGRMIEVQVRRPDRFHSEMRSTHRNRGLFYDGKSVTLVNRQQNHYGNFPAPATIDEALDVACKRFGVTLPLEDFVVSDPYQNAMRTITTGIDVGPVTVLGVACEHLAFTLDTVDWQIWIEQGARPVPRKFVITYKDEAGSPEYTAILSNWDFQTLLPDSLFNFAPSADTSKICVTEVKPQSPAPQAGDK